MTETPLQNDIDEPHKPAVKRRKMDSSDSSLPSSTMSLMFNTLASTSVASPTSSSDLNVSGTSSVTILT